MDFFIYLFIYSCFSLGIFNFDVLPKTSPDNPLSNKNVYEIVVTNKTMWDRRMLISVMRLSSNDSSKATLLNVYNTTLKSPFVQTYQKYFGYNYTRYKPEYIKINVYDGSTKELIATSPDVKTIYWDYSYSNLRYSFEFEEDGYPGSVYIIAKPATDFDSILEKKTRVWFFQSILFSSYPSSYDRTDNWLGGCENVQSQNTNKFHVVFNRPRIYYFSLQSYTSWGRGFPASGGLYTAAQPFNISGTRKFAGGAVVLCDSNDNCESLPEGFSGPVYYLKNKIPNDRQLPLLKRNVKVFEGTPLFIRWFGNYFSNWQVQNWQASFIDVELPKCMNVDTFYKPYNFVKTPSLDHSGYTNYNFTLSYQSNTFPLSLYFNSCIIYGNSYDIYLRIQTGAFQVLHVTPIILEEPKSYPNRLIISIPWSSLQMYKSLDVFRKLTFNQIPGPSYCYYSTNYYSTNWSPEARKQKYSGFSYCPENSLFWCDNADKTLCSLFTIIETVNASAIFNKCIPSSITGTQLTKEKLMLTQASSFFKSTGQKNRVNDIAYNGIVYQQHLTEFGKYLNATKPEYINFDIEDFISPDSFLSLLNFSQNALDRRKPGESDIDLVKRIYIEMLQDIENQFEKNSPNTAIIWFGAVSASNIGYYGSTFGSYETFKSIFKNFIVQPEHYNQKHPAATQDTVRGNRIYLEKNESIILMPTQGCWGETNPEFHRDWALHMLFGSLGFQLFPYYYVDDHMDHISIKEIIELLSPYEDLLIDGDLAYYDIVNIQNLVISGMKSNSLDIMLLGISPDYNPEISLTNDPQTFEVLNFANSIYYKAINIKTQMPVYYYFNQNNNLVFNLRISESIVILLVPAPETLVSSVVIGISFAIAVIFCMIFFIVTILIASFFPIFGKKRVSRM